MTYLTLPVAVNNIDPRHFSVEPCLSGPGLPVMLTRRGLAMIHFVLHEAKDTVAVAVVEGIKAGTDLTAWIMDDDKQFAIKALQDIPIGHKVALKDMAVGDTVFKYGTDIGRVVAPIKAGEHAHVHNIKTKRW
jgi:(2R)-sulfolactate sulfo-lyase subunit alpha